MDLSGLIESIVDSDEEDLESDIGSLAGLRDSVRECLEKDPSERTEDDVEVLLDLMGHLPVSWVVEVVGRVMIVVMGALGLRYVREGIKAHPQRPEE